jgi:hypothetical protein
MYIFYTIIHQSCPAIGVYNEINLETALTSATINFLSESVQNEKNTIHISKLFLWQVIHSNLFFLHVFLI